MNVDTPFPLKKSILIMFECVTTHYQNIRTWIGHNATRCHDFNALPHALPQTLPCNFSQFSMVSDYLQRSTTHYCQIHKKTYINIFLRKK